MVKPQLGSILNSHTVATLRKEITRARRNLGGTAKMKKQQLINHMMRTPSLFSHMKMRVRVSRAKPRRKTTRRNEPSLNLGSIGLGLRRGRGLSGGMTHTASRKLGAVLRRALNRKR